MIDDDGPLAEAGARADGGDAALSIRQISAQSGVSEGTLRMWETRYRFPNPLRLASGHRRYSEHDLEQVRAVLRAREQGLSLPSAIEHARRLGQGPRPSIFAALRESFPHLQPHLLPKPAVHALSRAIEDECLARAQRPLLFGCFQHERFYRASEARWRELARTADQAYVLADFSGRARTGRNPVEVSIDDRDPLAREWVVSCESPGFTACLAGWERPSETDGPSLYETIWTVEPAAVRTAGRVCCELVARTAGDQVDGLRQRLAGPVSGPGAELSVAMDLTTRMVLYALGG